jgi:hypothetical protein
LEVNVDLERPDRLAPSERQQLERHLDRGDWQWSDIADVREMLPRCMRSLLDPQDERR